MNRIFCLILILGFGITAQAAPPQKTNTTLKQLRSLKNPSAGLIYHTTDIPGDWKLDPTDHANADNTGTILVTADGKRMKRQYTGAVHTAWFGFFNPGADALNGGKSVRDRLVSIFANYRDIFVDKGTYSITVKSGSNIQIYSNSKVQFEKGALWVVQPNDLGNNKQGYNVVTIDSSSNIQLSGINIQGDKHNHLGKGGEWAHGIQIKANSENINLNDIMVTQMWGDGLDIIAALRRDKQNKALIFYGKNITVQDFTIDDCGRNGISVEGVNNLLIKDGTISKCNRTSPKSGIDLEPGYYGKQWGSPTENNITIENVTMSDNFIGLVFSDGTQKVTVKGCVFQNNSRGLHINHIKSTAIIGDCQFLNNDFSVTSSQFKNASLSFDNCTMIYNKLPVNGKRVNTRGVIINSTNAEIKLNKINLSLEQGAAYKGIEVTNPNGNTTISNCKITKAKNYAFYLSGKNGSLTLIGNQISGTTKGIFVDTGVRSINFQNNKIIGLKAGNQILIRVDKQTQSAVFQGNQPALKQYNINKPTAKAYSISL